VELGQARRAKRRERQPAHGGSDPIEFEGLQCSEMHWFRRGRQTAGKRIVYIKMGEIRNFAKGGGVT
jgi:hypothetical protein